MNNPYEVLELNENATIDEIKKAYREKVKQYHPDQYINNPLKDLAEEKMREVNEAYEYLMKNHDSYNNYNTTSYGSIRQDINLGNTSSAEYKLNNIKVRDAEWYYLMGLVSLRKGWFNDGYNYIQRACQMEPNNFEYRDTLNKIDRRNSSYRETYNRRYSEDNDMCRLCMGLFCADKCCECCGGDLISCC